MDRKDDKQVWTPIPDWLKKVEDEEVFAAIGTLLFDWNFSGEDEIDNLHDYLKENFPDLSEEKVEKVAGLLIEHKLVKAN